MSENIVLQDEEENVMIATFNIATENTTITLKNLEGMTQIDWGDGTIDNKLSHTYSAVGEYICKIYDVTSIGKYAFSSCSSLTSVVIGDSVTSIGGAAFRGCGSLIDVTFKNRTPLTVDILQNSKINQTNPTYYVPKESLEAYRSAWKGTVAAEQIQINPDERLINLQGLRTYHDTLKEKYLNSMATQNWVNEQLIGKTDYLGVVDTIPNFPNAEAGDYCRVQTEFVYDETTGEKAHVGDILIAIKDNPTQSINDWDLLHNELTSATLVTVGGVAQTSWDADTKVGFDHITSPTQAGLMIVGEGLIASSLGNGKVNIRKAEKTDIDAKTQNYKPITPILVEYATMKSLTDVKDTTIWTDDTTDEEGNVVKGTKTKACETIGAMKKSTKVTTRPQLYMKNPDGTNKTVDATTEAGSSTIPLYSPQGKLSCTAPTANYHTVNKEYADNGFVAKSTEVTTRQQVYVKEPDGTQKMVTLSTDFLSNGIPRYNEYGRLTCADPTSAYNITNKRYVDGLVGDINTVLEAIMGV